MVIPILKVGCNHIQKIPSWYARARQKIIIRNYIMENKFQFTIEEHFLNEESAALTLYSMRNEYFKFQFEGRENGRGGYELIAYSDKLISKSKQVEFVKVAWIIYRAMGVARNELNNS